MCGYFLIRGRKYAGVSLDLILVIEVRCRVPHVELREFHLTLSEDVDLQGVELEPVHQLQYLCSAPFYRQRGPACAILRLGRTFTQFLFGGDDQEAAMWAFLDTRREAWLQRVTLAGLGDV